MASTLSLRDILQALDALSDQERAVVQQHLEHGTGPPTNEKLFALLATWDDSITLQDAEESSRTPVVTLRRTG